MLHPLLVDQSGLVNGQLLLSDESRAMLQLESLVSNWLVRMAELIGAELLDACHECPKLYCYLFSVSLLSTCYLNRLCNQLST